MGRAPCCDKANVKKGPWSPEEDSKLKEYIDKYGTGGNWIALPQKAGLKRCGKSCRLRWLNYLRPNLKHGDFSDDEDRVICSLFASIGSRWSIIASQLPGRTDNDIKNYWNTKLKKKLLGIFPHQTTPTFQNKQTHLPSSHESSSSQSSCYTYNNSNPLCPPTLLPHSSSTTLPTPSAASILPTFPLQHQAYQMKDGVLCSFEAADHPSCSSSDERMSLESYFYNGCVLDHEKSNQKILWEDEEAPILQNCSSSNNNTTLEEIKQLISSSSNGGNVYNSTSFTDLFGGGDDQTGMRGGNGKSPGIRFMYY